jgi:redox-sensitive bicupin YhaK (pirin superfamily)
MPVSLYAGSRRFRSTGPDRTTRHSFSFGPHYDPANLGLGPLVVHNDDSLGPAGGVEIVTWVLAGALVHTDSLGNRSVLGPGVVQVQSAGSGIRHAEMADPTAGGARFVQAWLRPDEPGLAPVRHAAPLDPGPGVGLLPAAGGDGLALGVAGASLLVARLGPGETVTLPHGSRQHVFVAAGRVALVGAGEPVTPAAAGDAWRVEDAPRLRVRALAPSELLVWALS